MILYHLNIYIMTKVLLFDIS